MALESYHRLVEMFQQVSELDPAARETFLVELCAGNDELRREIDAMLEADRIAGEFLENPPDDFAAAVLCAINSGETGRLIPKTLGQYRLLRILGEGGMGVVYEAEEEHPRRIVALKLIKPGFLNRDLLRRFDRETAVLARLHHPGIAQIYEAGTIDGVGGRQPFFAMEYVQGAPLNKYVQSHGLHMRQRLELVIRICDGVEHAHQNGVIHRDLKPANILVEETGQPKILDFGVARVTDSEAHASKQTDLGQLVGTLVYMSPEQVAADPLELDTRSDVYALGVILYELLADRLPYQLSQQLPEAVRTIREEDPPALSSINRAYRGDVQTIVAKALEKDKTRRYASAADLAADIRRHLADEPIKARPATLSYQLHKFARRHRTLVMAMAVVVLTLVGGVVISAREALMARRAEQSAEAVNDFLQNDLLAQASATTQAGPRSKPDPDLKVRTALDRAAARITAKFQRQPEVEASIRDTIGVTYGELGLYPEASKHLELALELQSQYLGVNNPKTLRTMSRLGRIAELQGSYAQAERLFSQAFESQRRVEGLQHPDTLFSMNGLANVDYFEGKYPQAEALDLQTLEIRKRMFGPDNASTLNSMHSLAMIYHAQGKYAQAETLYSQTLEIQRRVRGPEHPTTLNSMNNLAIVLDAEGKYSSAEALYNQTLDIGRRVLGPQHPQVVNSMDNLGLNYILQGKYPLAEALFSQALDVSRHALGPERPETLHSMSGLGYSYQALGKYMQAEALFSKILEIQRRRLGSEHPETLDSSEHLAVSYYLQGKYAPAEALFGETIEKSRRVLGPKDPAFLGFLADYASMYERQGKYALAETYAAQSLAGRRDALGSKQKDTMVSAADLALVHLSQGKFPESESLAREALEFDRQNQPDDWQRFRAASLLGESLERQKKYAEAEPLLQEGYQGMLARMERIAVPDWYHLSRAHEWLVQVRRARGEPEKPTERRER